MKVKVYSTPTCPYCAMVKDLLTRKGVDFEEIDVSKDMKAAEEMVKKSGQMGVPVTEMGDTIIVGFDKNAIESVLAKSAKAPKKK